MAQYHHVIYFDTADEQWHYADNQDCYLPDGPVWGHTSFFLDNSEGHEVEWRVLDEYEEPAHLAQGFDLVKFLNTNPHLEA